MGFLIKKDDVETLPAELQEELEQESADNLEGVQPRLPKVQMPTGNSRVFTLEQFGDEEEQLPKFEAVILYQSAAKAYWATPFGGESASVVPDCASHDGVKPSAQYNDLQADNCAECPHNRFGTGIDADGNKTRGKACRDVKRVVLLKTDDTDVPYLLTLPPTSLRSFDDYMVHLRKEKRPYWSVVTDLSLVTETNNSGIKYPKAIFSSAGYINHAETLQKIKDSKKEWGTLLANTLFAAVDVAPSEPTPQKPEAPEESPKDGEPEEF